VKVEARGIFVGARVVRGPDWDWGDQDGKYACWQFTCALETLLLGRGRLLYTLNIML